MSCSSCGQKYRNSSSSARSQQIYRQSFRRGQRIVTPTPTPPIDTPQPPVTVQPDTPAAIAPGPLSEAQTPTTTYTLTPSVTSKEYAIDPTTGLPVSQLTTGSCPENMLGDTAPQPVDLQVMDTPGSKNEVG